MHHMLDFILSIQYRMFPPHSILNLNLTNLERKAESFLFDVYLRSDSECFSVEKYLSLNDIRNRDLAYALEFRGYRLRSQVYMRRIEDADWRVQNWQSLYCPPNITY